jgi:pimeloyl-ACP methyl ester carboxylesterase
VSTNATNTTNIVLVHGGWADGSGWSKQIPVLRDAGYKVIAAQLPTHSLSDDVETVKRAIAFIGGPTILVGHSYGGEVITNAAYNNPNVTGLVYIAAFVPDEGQSLSSFADPNRRNSKKKRKTKIMDYIKASLLAYIAKILFFHIIVGLRCKPRYL